MILLESLQKGLFEVAGQLQHQLYLLDDIRARLLALDPSNGGQGSQGHGATT